MAARTHGMSGTAIYRRWQHMISRCSDPTDKDYEDYGGRGISYDPRWVDFEYFYADMGDVPGEGYTLDREDNDGDYCKSNCRWATHSQQHRNHRRNVMVSVNGTEMCLKDACELLTVNYSTARTRHRYYGWDIRDVLEVRDNPNYIVILLQG